MIWSVFPFFNELEVLEIKLAEQDSVVDRFRIIESTLTHAGNEKPLYFQDNKERFARWLLKIDHVIHEAEPGPDYWGRERSQRNIGIARDSFNPDDLVIVSDLDEIVSADTIRRWDGEWASFLLPMHVYRLNWRWVEEPKQHWQIAGGSLAKDLPVEGTHFRWNPCREVPDAGWHFTFMGGAERIRTKLKEYAHAAEVEPILGFPRPEASWERGVDLFGRDITIETTDNLPEYLLSHRERFAGLFA